MATRKDPALRLTWTATQGSADAFIEVAIPTGLQSVGAGASTAIRIIELGIETAAMPEVDCNWEVAITRQSMAAIPNVSERSLLNKFKWQIALTTSGMIYVPDLVKRWQPAEAANVILVESSIYCQLDSAGTGASNGVTGYLLGEYIKVSESERLQLVAQSLEQ